jgi:hypothetical protein
MSLCVSLPYLVLTPTHPNAAGYSGLDGFDADPLAGLDAFKMDPLAGIKMEPLYPGGDKK